MAGNNNNSICIGFKPSITDPTIAIPDPNDLNAIYVAERTCRHHRNKRHNATQTPDLGYPNWRKRHHPVGGGGGGIECCVSSCCCYCCHCHCHPHHHCHGTTMLPSNNQRQKSLNRLVAAKRLPELPSSKNSKLAPESSQSLSSPDDREDIAHHKHHQQQQQQRHMHSRPHQQQRRHHNQCSRLPEKIPTGGTIAIEIDAATLTDDISYCSSISNNSFALAMANETTNSKDILVHCSGGGCVDNHLPRDHRRRKSRTRAHHCGQKSSHIDSVCSTTSTTTEDEVIIVQRKCKRGRKFIARQETIDGAADVEEEDDDEKLNKSKPETTTMCCDDNCCTALNEGVKIKRKNFTNRYYCSSCSKCSSCSCCQQEQDGQLHHSCSFSSSLSHIEDGDCDQIDDEVCSRCDAKPNVNGGEESDVDDAAGDHSSSQQSAESFCSCNSTSRCYCSCSCDESDTIRKESCTTTPVTMSNVSTPVGPVGDCAAVDGIVGKNCAEDAFSMAGKSSVSQSEYFSLSSDKPPSHSLASSPMSPPPTESVMPSPPALPRKHCKHYSKHHRHKSDGNFDSVL